MSFVRGRTKQLLALQAALALLVATLVIIVAQPVQAVFPGANGWIVFQNGSDIYAMPSDGSQAPTNLTPGVDPYADPVFSPDGTKLAFARAQAGLSSVWVATFNPGSPPSLSGETKISTPAAGEADGEPTWSPDGTAIAYERLVPYVLASGTTDGGPSATVLSDADGDFVTAGVTVGMTVTNTGDAGSTGTVVAVAAGSVTVDALVGGTDNLFEVGDAYSIGHVNLRVYAMASTGAGQVKLSAAGAGDLYDDGAPAWSPANNFIAFDSNRAAPGVTTDIFTMTIAGGSETNRTGGGDFDAPASRASWSPDGAQVAFHALEPSSNFNIWRLPISGGSAVQITGPANTGTDNDLFPTFSPDGTLIAFQQGGSGGSTTHTVSATDGSGLAEIRSDGAPHAEADWQPALSGVADAYSVDEGAQLVVPAAGVLSNDSLLTPAIGTATAVKVTDPVNGSVTVNANGSFTYTHDGSETTSDSFTYRPVQAGVQGSVATVSISVTPVDEVPVAVNDGPFLVGRGDDFTAAVPGVLGNDSDPEGGGLTAVKVSDPANGSVTLNANGSFTYTHDGSETTSDSFTYQAKDAGDNLSNVATVSFTVTASGSVHASGLVDPLQGRWYLFDDAGGVVKDFYFGNPGDVPFMGDWNGDGVETPGLYRQSDGFVYLRQTNTQGPADISFFFGNPGDIPIAGDFDGDGFDTVSIYRPSNQTFYIINELGTDGGGLGAAEFSYVFGNPGDKPFVGDFDGDGVETVGLHRESTGLVYFRNSHSQGNADASFIFGNPDDRLIAGDWNGDGAFSPALFRPSQVTMYFRFTNTAGNADNQFVPAQVGSTWLPISGRIG